MTPFRITFADLMETARSFPQEVRDDPSRLTFTMAVSVIRHFFGQPWCEEHIIQDAAHSRPAGFLRLDFTPGFEGERKTSAFSISPRPCSICSTSRDSTIA